MAMAMRAAAAAGLGGLSLRGLLFSTLTSTSPFILRRLIKTLRQALCLWHQTRSTTEGLQDAFSKFGDVVHCFVGDHVSGYSNGFGFVRYATREDLCEGIKGMDGKVSFWVDEYARPRPQPSQFKNNAGSQPPGHGSPYGRQ
ncbi:hypothetical protein LOK49_LG07G03260 [Camellia lanceoleosa]|uniref:Uncharacterized protein n=1 Tax=Camellia lanceoleosa TaxID=1840588 RepID=A0ACC0H4C6_9ERIC|nr:hypothetical protein LOK49_LG07G03260 [Camellia lanceoleosa]